MISGAAVDFVVIVGDGDLHSPFFGRATYLTSTSQEVLSPNVDE
jgi:hypothetical protein